MRYTRIGSVITSETSSTSEEVSDRASYLGALFLLAMKFLKRKHNPECSVTHLCNCFNIVDCICLRTPCICNLPDGSIAVLYIREPTMSYRSAYIKEFWLKSNKWVLLFWGENLNITSKLKQLNAMYNFGVYNKPYVDLRRRPSEVYSEVTINKLLLGKAQDSNIDDNLCCGILGCINKSNVQVNDKPRCYTHFNLCY